eukprot:c7348_g1_i1.p1 GENE.c7348_g1_i1~~c7348_g1_i1.p1  ORF type:complete len:466 (+),score=128.52 c7348_g1_i1:41-1438(+)
MWRKQIGLILVALLVSSNAIGMSNQIELSRMCFPSQMEEIHNSISASSPLIAIGAEIAMSLENVLKRTEGKVELPEASTSMLLELSTTMCSNSGAGVQLTAPQPRPCLVQRFSGNFTTTDTLTVTKVNALTEYNCQALSCESKSLNLGYIWNAGTGTCSHITNVTTTSTAVTSFCVQRGGCSGTQDSTSCVWRTVNAVDFSTVLTANVSEKSLTVADCEVACEVSETCGGYSFDFSSNRCSLLSSSSSGTDVIGVTLPGLSFTGVPSECWMGEVCTPAMTVSVPAIFGLAKVVLKTSNSSGDITGVTRIRSDDDGVATFSNVTFTTEGEYELIAASEGIECSGSTGAITVRNKNSINMIRGLSEGFPTDQGFLIIRFKQNCQYIALVIACIVGGALILLMSALGILLSFSIPKMIGGAVLVLGVVVVMKDAIQAWQVWQCTDTIKNSVLSPIISLPGSLKLPHIG